MTLRIAINGFGRIGRSVFRILSKCSHVEIVAINDLLNPEALAYLLIHDSVHGRFDKKVEVKGNSLVVDNKETLIVAETDPLNLPWKAHNIDYVIESTGRFTDLESASKHITAGAKKVVISAPAKGGVPHFVMGVNHKQYDPLKDHVVSNASCTTNCLAPITKVLLDNFGIEEGLMTTCHAVTATQSIVDSPSKKDFRGGRSSLANIIPASTGAAKAVALCIPEVVGKLTGMALRVPVIDVSVVDLTVKLTQSTDYDKICEAMKSASEGELKGVLGYTEEMVVSTDFIGDPRSSIFDRHAGIALNDKFFKVISWYDNEIGYAHRICDLVKYMACDN
ncbi:MAG: type I glyceraldehyde-3-phosphate dehydrogenase [Rhabdochlamydiaceae bacterium]|nr:type I glyceraldehyde-3-phosphate dehydrogenase [Candidatus Amphrikana amoebophyrae]